MNDTAKNFTEQLKTKLGADLKAVFLYGSAAGAQYLKKHSDINILIIASSMDIDTLTKISAIKNRPVHKGIALLVFTKEYLENSADIFPIEFLDIKESHVVLYGQDYLKNLKIDLINLKYQCEWELKSKLLQLEKFYIGSKGNKRALQLFLIKELPSFLTIFKNLLRLNGPDLNFDKDILNKLQLARQGKFKIDDIYGIFGKFFSELKRLSDAIDKLPVKSNV